MIFISPKALIGRIIAGFQVDETEKVSSTIVVTIEACCEDRVVDSDRPGVRVAGFAPLHQPRIVPGDIGVSED